jgi:putative aminopeptidase protein
MKQKLINLAVGELVAVTVFWMNFFIFKKLLITAKSLITISFPLFILSFILIQGAVFWCILAKRISKPGFALKYTGKIYSKLKVLDVILLFVEVLVIILNYSGFLTMLIAFAIWIFAVIEWVNYYKLQLSYSLNPLILLKYIMQRKLRKSKIAKEIDKIY